MDIHVRRLSLDVPAMEAEDARRLATLVAEGLGALSADGLSGRHESRLSVRVTATEGASVERLAEAVVAELAGMLP
jgi:hypothetical protein